MKYPSHELAEYRIRPVKEVVSLLASRERGYGKDHATLMERSSHALGQLCVDLAQSRNTHNSRRKKLLRAARPQVSPVSAERVLFDMISFHKSPAYVERAQQVLHKRMIDELRIHLCGNRVSLSGLATETAATALLTRRADPDMVVFPSLRHHESDAALTEHYDIGVSSRRGDAVSTHLLQVKTCCEGRCQGARVAVAHASQYAPSIQFVSGCCDLDMDYTSLENGDNTHLPRLLIAEYDEIATPDQIATLDFYTDTLIHNIVTDQLPRGAAASFIDLRSPDAPVMTRAALSA